MKKIIVITILIVAAAFTANAQPRAVGARVGFGAGISYEHSIGNNMIQLDVDAPAFWGGVEAACTYDWINPFGASIPWNGYGEWNWYLGAGLAGGVVNWFWPMGFTGGVGRVGIEYKFSFPMEISLDFRPTLGAFFGDGLAGFYWDVYAGGLGLSVRYCFGGGSSRSVLSERNEPKIKEPKVKEKKVKLSRKEW